MMHSGSISTLELELTIFNGHNITTRHHITPEFKKLRFRLAVRVGDQERETTVAAVSKDSFPVWNSKFTYDNVAQSHALALELFCHHKHRKTHKVGFSQEIGILSLQPFQRHEIRLCNKRGAECGRICVGVHIPVVIRRDRQSHARRQNLQIDIHNLQAQQISPAWSDLLFSLQSLVRFAEIVAQLDPMARLVVTTVSFAFKIAVQQCERDERIDGLIEMMASIYYLILEAESLEKIKSFATTIERLLETTKECALFVADYFQEKNFAIKAIRGAMSSVDSLIESFEKAFTALRMEFVTNVCLHDLLQTNRILEEVQDIAKGVHDINAAMNLPVHGAGWDSQNMCSQGSQEFVLDEVNRWATFQGAAKPVYLLVGPAGCGKTCIANSTAALFASGKRLGASIFLYREKEEHRNPDRIFTSIARELAAFDDKFKVRISRAISQQPRLPTSDLERQLQGLIIKPLRDLTVIGPILIVIDGLDVLQDRHRGRVLSALKKNSSSMPRNLRILVTARPEDDIITNWADVSYIRQVTADEEGLVNDVPQYVRQCLDIFQDIRPSVFADISLKEVLAEFEAKSRGVFLWLSVAIRFLAIASDGTVRAFLSEISSAAGPTSYAETMPILEQAIYRALTAASPVKLKSELSVGGAAALGVIGLKSDKTSKLLETMVTQGLLKYDDKASQYLSAMRHPSSRFAITGDHACSHTNLQGSWNTDASCMAHVCIDFLEIRLASDVCGCAYRTRNKDEVVIDSRLVRKPPEYIRAYISEAYRYAREFWMAHLEDVQSCCGIELLGNKLRHFSRHFCHFLEFERKKVREVVAITERFLSVLEGSKLNDHDLSSRIQTLLIHYDGSKDRKDLEYRDPARDPAVDPALRKACNFCPLSRVWKISRPNVCSLKEDMVFKGMSTGNPLCLTVSPPVMPVVDQDGQICRVIKGVEIVVEQTSSDDGPQHFSPTVQIGVVIARANNGILPEWARKASSPIRNREGVADQMKRPWLCPRAGSILSAVVRWEDEILWSEVDPQLQCPLQPGDRLGIVAHSDKSCDEAFIRFSVTLNVEYECNQSGEM